MCVRNTTTDAFNTLVSPEVALVPDVQAANSESQSLMMPYLHPLLISTTLPGLLMLLSWLLWLTYYRSFRSNASHLPLPPGSMGLPLIGETLTFFFLGANFYRKRLKLYGNVFKTHLLGSPVVRVVGAKNVRKILMGENTLVASSNLASLRVAIGLRSMSTATGSKHRFLRKGVAKAFSHDALSSYAPVMQQVVRDFIQCWCDKNYVNCYQECRSLAFYTACRTLLGLNHMSEPQVRNFENLFKTLVDNLFSLPVNLPGWGMFKLMRARKLLMEKIEECISVVQQSPEMTSSGRHALWLMMNLEREEKLTTDELKDLSLELLFAGYATLASAFTSLFYYLARTPRVVHRILQELKDHGLRNSDVTDLTLDSVGRLQYTGNVVKEVLRLAPPVGGGFRVALKTFELDGYQIPAGWKVAYSIRETQAVSHLFTNPDQFQPERWERPVTPGEETFHFLPFGGGARSCIGKEYAKLFLRIFTVEICRTCRWRLLNENVEMKFMPVPYPVDGLPIHITRQDDRPRAATL